MVILSDSSVMTVWVYTIMYSMSSGSLSVGRVFIWFSFGCFFVKLFTHYRSFSKRKQQGWLIIKVPIRHVLHFL